MARILACEGAPAPPRTRTPKQGDPSSTDKVSPVGMNRIGVARGWSTSDSPSPATTIRVGLRYSGPGSWELMCQPGWMSARTVRRASDAGAGSRNSERRTLPCAA